MSMQLKDIIQYYVGQPCMYDDPYYNSYNLSGQVTERIIQEVRNPQITGAVKNVRPHLRRLSDMEEDEAKHLFQLAYCSFVAYEPMITEDSMGYQHGTTIIHETVRCIRFDTYVDQPEVKNYLPFSLLQLDDELIWGKFSNAGEVLLDDITSNQFNQFHYLLQRGFDLFGLIDSGQAVDVKTIKQ